VLGIGLRAVFEHAFAGFKTQVQAIKGRVSFFKMIDHTQTLQVVLEPSVFRHAFIQGILSSMSKRRMSQVVRQGNGFHQVFIQRQGTRNGTAQLRDFE
jgi:hypothetical protein